MKYLYKYLLILTIIPFILSIKNIYNENLYGYLYIQNIISLYIILIESIIIKFKLKSKKNPLPNYFISIVYVMFVYTSNILMHGYIANDIKNILIIIILNVLYYISWSNFKNYETIDGLMYSSIIFATMINISLTFEKDLKSLIIGWLLISLMNIFLAIKTKNTLPLLISFVAPLSILYQTGLTDVYFLDFIIFFTLSSIISYIAYNITKNIIYSIGPLIGLYLFILVNNIVYYSIINLFISIIFTILATIVFYILNNKFQNKTLFIATYASAMTILLLINLLITNLAIALYITTIILILKYREVIKVKYYSLK